MLSDGQIDGLLRLHEPDCEECGVAGMADVCVTYLLAEEVQARRAAERLRPSVLEATRAVSFDRHVDEALRVTWPAPHGPEGYEA